MTKRSPQEREELDKERYELLSQIDDWSDLPLAILGFVWLALLVIELIWGLTPALEMATTIIWIIFILDFAIDIVLAPDKKAYLRNNWLMVIALIVPAFRAFRIIQVLRYARAARGLTLTRMITSLNRGMKALRLSMGRRGLGYVVLLTSLVTLAGSAGIYAFEKGVNPDLSSFGNALWFTAMMMTTMGSDYWPKTPEGRVLAVMLGIYAFAVFGYVTAALASFFVGRDADSDNAELAGIKHIKSLQEEVEALRSDVHALSDLLKEERRGKG
ncbi:MAG TPA: ion transporter [Methanotrichaceae archaeon]|nr:ion transporter [Methanotrichaceae archaeon]